MDQLRPPGDSMPFPAPRRHSTVPTSFQPAPSRPPSNSVSSNGSVETLFNHPSVKIVAFSAGKSAFDRPGPGSEDKPGSLPSSSQFERTIAVGAFQIYRAPGSVAFLRCGSALQPILPKSQCWTLDERSSKFALQIRRPNYWRIEVPVSDDEDTRRALVLREILDKILQFEKTPCPFERDFTVQLPERPTTPIKKKPWTPPVRSVSMNWPPQPVTPPPEFATRTRFYNPNARRHSDFGVDLSKTRATPETPEAKPEGRTVDGSANIGTPTRPPSRRILETMETPRQETIPEEANPEESIPEFGIKFRSVLEEAEPLTPPLTAIPPELAKKTVEPAPGAATVKTEVKRAEDLEASPKAPETQRTLAVAKKREPIWITKKPSATARKLQRPALPKAQSAGPTASTVSRNQSGKMADTVEKSKLPECSANQDLSPSANNAKRSDSSSPSDTEEAGSIEGAGQMRLRRTRVAAFASRRAATAPALRLRTSTPALNLPEETPEEVPAPSSPAESSDSFHSTQSWHSPLAPPSPPMSPRRAYPYPHENIPLARTGDGSESAATPTISVWEKSSTGAVAGSGAGTPITPFYNDHNGTDVPTENRDDVKLSGESATTTPAIPIATGAVEDSSEHTTAADTDSLSTSWSSAASRTSSPGSNTAMRHRAATTSVSISHTSPRALSPLPPPANLFTPRQGLRRLPSTAELSNRASTAVKTIRRIPSAILNRTCEMIFGPPAHLINLMLKVAARIAAGEFRGFVFGVGEGGEVVDVRWDWSDEHSDIDESPALEGWDEADFNFGDDARRQAANRISRGRKMRASFAAADLSRPSRAPGKAIEYQDPWATADDEDEDPSRSWGVD
ncbi:hypothetical protein J7T55_009887 [Diaporthe amygdali]|uniref:uncharacterized protein n=1 Tax=Phomopsis amygdali TaxID=1214568 RepID=UPI0022FDBB67|nr:uncharacterized protein J7T55_009887 [Diaporthe amygdali]KAJ0116737.1 hypothetical protein J7T55_009887 [Diaporthe amygdali]